MSSGEGSSGGGSDSSQHGTTNIGLKTQSFQILATDMRITSGYGFTRLVLTDASQKLYEISSFSNIHCTLAGSVTHWLRMYSYVKLMVAREEGVTKKPTTVDFVKKMVEQHCLNCANYRYKREHNYSGILAGWPKEGTPQMYSFIVTQNKPVIEEIGVGADAQESSNFVTVGSGEAAAGLLMLRSKGEPLADRDDAANRCLRAIFRADNNDMNTGGGAEVGCLEEGVYTRLFLGNTLEVYSRCVEADEDPVMILFVPHNTLTERMIQVAWEKKYKVASAVCIGSTQDFLVHRVRFLTDDWLEKVRQFFLLPEETQVPHPEPAFSLRNFLLALPVVTINGTVCRAANKSKTIIDLLCA